MAKHAPTSESAVSDDHFAWLTRVAFFLALTLVIARATISEILRDPLPVPGPGSVDLPIAPGPAVIITLNLLCCLPAMLVLFRRAVDRSYVLRWSWSSAILIALASLAMLSTLWSADQFAAIVTGSTFVAGALLFWASAQLVRSWGRLRVVAAVVTGLLIVYLASGVMYRAFDVPDMRDYWQKNRTEELARRGWEPDSFIAQQFERKLLRGEMIGYFQSANTFAAVVVMCLIVALGTVIQRLIARDGAAWVVAGVAFMGVAYWLIYFTESRTAFATPILAGAMLLGWALLGRRVAPHSAVIYFSGVLLTILGIVLLVAHGMQHNTLFHDSLTFRWKYWVGSARIFEQYPALGVGWSNFGLHYLAVRLPEASEEIKDPHNLIVRSFVELGVVGGFLLIAWMLRLTWELTRSVRPAATSAHVRLNEQSWGVLPQLAALVGGATLIAILAGVDLFRHPDAEIIERIILAMAMFIGMAIATIRGTQDPSLDDRPAPWVIYGGVVAVAIFLIHNLIDFSFFETGPMLLFATLAGALVGVRTPGAPGRRRYRGAAVTALAAVAIFMIGMIVTVAVPVADAEAKARLGDAALRAGRPDLAATQFEAAYNALPLNPDYAFRQTGALIAAQAPLPQIEIAVANTIHSNPLSIDAHLLRARYELRRPAPDVDVLNRDFGRVLVLNPNDVAVRLEYAESVKKYGEKSRAANQYEIALRYNDALDPNEPKRLSISKVDEIKSTIRELRAQ